MSREDRSYAKQIAAVREAVGLDTMIGPLAWGTMTYACQGPREVRLIAAHGGPGGCGWEHRVWMCVGVEGPPALRANDLYIPAPFFCGQCPDCDSPLAHVRWDEDEEWPEPLPLAVGAAYFSLPSKRRARKNAEYTDPSGRTTAKSAA